MKTKHTPGEWRVNRTFINDIDSYVITARMPNVRQDICVISKSTDKEERNNAQLIAASRDLLLALQQIQFAVKSGDVKGLFKDEIEKMDSAIEKATK